MDSAAIQTIAEWSFWGYSAAAAGYALLGTLLFVSWRGRNLRALSGVLLAVAAITSMLWAAAVASD